MESQKGYIYILTNPSYPDLVKIGYTQNLKQRLNELNRSECIPYSFRLYASYEVETKLADKQLHLLIDKINPDLRIVNINKGKKRTREFFEMAPEDAYALLKAMAEIHGCKDKLKLYKKSEEDKRQENEANEAREKAKRRDPLSFDMIGIEPGEEICYINDPTIKATVISNRKVLFEGEETYLSPIAQKLEGKDSLQGSKFFTYHGKRLTELREEVEAKEASEEVDMNLLD